MKINGSIAEMKAIYHASKIPSNSSTNIGDLYACIYSFDPQGKIIYCDIHYRRVRFALRSRKRLEPPLYFI